MNTPAGKRTAPSDDARLDPARLAQANINPSTGLATDYLNHFNEAIMLLDLLSDCPDCVEDFLAWRPMNYREHFASSRFKDRALALEAYESADPVARHCLDTLADTMTAVLESVRKKMTDPIPAEVAARIAQQSASLLKPLVAHAGAIINGETTSEAQGDVPQAAVDALMKR